MPASITPTSAVTLTFSPNDLSHLEAFAALHGTTVAAFIQNAALEAAHIAPATKSAKSKSNDPSALWLSESFAEVPEEEKEPELFAPVEAVEKPEAVVAAPAPKRGVVGERSRLAKGHGLVWEIRRALGRERVHGLGWTHEQLAFVLRLSVVGVRKMEHRGTTPVKSLESRKALSFSKSFLMHLIHLRHFFIQYNRQKLSPTPHVEPLPQRFDCRLPM